MSFRIVILLIIFVARSNCDRFVWLGSTDIYDPKNWRDGKKQGDCNGFVYAEASDIPSFINHLKVRQLVLPEYGTVFFEEGSEIEFDQNSRSDLNCVELNTFIMGSWKDTTMWKNLDNPDNLAVPYSERIPCRYDDVILPKGFNASIYLDFSSILVKTLTFGKEKLTQDESDALFSSDVSQEVFLKASYGQYKSPFRILGEECEDLTGCDRRASLSYGFSPILNIQCSDSIVPVGNWLEPICGGIILIKKLKSGFTIEKIKTKLKDYASYTHASKYEPENHIQIIFTEKEFTGSSLLEAREFYNILKKDESYFCDDIEFETSGPPLGVTSMLIKQSSSLIFGTLLGAIIIFGLLFFVYSPTMGSCDLRNRLLGARPLSSYILRYDNVEDRANIIDQHSVAGSVLSLHGAFENPMYDHASTRSTSTETVDSPKSEGDDKDKSKKETVNGRNVELEGDRALEVVDLLPEGSKEHDEMLLKDL